MIKKFNINALVLYFRYFILLLLPLHKTGIKQKSFLQQLTQGNFKIKILWKF